MQAIFYSESYPSLSLRVERKKIEFDNHFFVTSDVDVIFSLRKYLSNQTLKPSFKEITSRKIENNDKPMKILVQRMGGIGDVLFTTPIVHHLKSLGHTVNYYLHHGYYEVLQGNPDVNKVYVNEKLVRNSKVPKAFGNILLEDTGLIPYDYELPEYMTENIFKQHDKILVFQGCIEKNPAAEKMHAIDACYEWIGLNPTGKPKDMVLNISDAEKNKIKNKLKSIGYDLSKPLLGLSPDASFAKNRSWRPALYKKFIRMAKDNGYQVIYLHRGQGFTMREAFAVVSVLDLLITVDTGLLHVAGAVGTPIIALFGSFNPDFRCSYFKNCHVLTNTNTFCFDHSDYCKVTNKRGKYTPCMYISPERVIKKLKEVLPA